MSKGSLRASSWVWFARLSADTRTRKRAKGMLGVGAAGIFVLGLLGWRQFYAERPEVEMGAWTLVYRSLALFTGEAAEPYDVPWELQAARILALVVVGFSLIVAAVRFMTEQLIAKGARKAFGHSVMIGPSGLPETVLAARERHDATAERSVIIRVEVHDGGGSSRDSVQQAAKHSSGPDRITIHVDPDDVEWLTKTNATRANLVVLSDESDRQTIRRARQLLDVGQATGGHLIVNLNRWESAQWFDLFLAQRYPAASVEVGCVAEAAIVEQILRKLPDLRELDSNRPELALAGRSATNEVVLRLLVRQLLDFYYGRFAYAPPAIYLVDLDDRSQPEQVGVDSDFIKDQPLVLCDEGAKLSPLRHALIFVIDDDPDRASLLELQLLTRFAPDEMVIRLDPDSLMREGVAPITTRAAMHILRGPVYALAQTLLEESSERATDTRRVNLTGRGDAPTVTREQLQRARQIIGQLGKHGQRVITRDKPLDQVDELSSGQLSAIARSFQQIDHTMGSRSVIDDGAASNLRWDLVHAGYDFDADDA